MSAVRVKKEKAASSSNSNQTTEDKEIEEWAKRLANRPTPQIGNAPGLLQQGTLTGYIIQSTAAGHTEGAGIIPANNGFDLDSAIGRFTWATIAEDKYVPCIYRSGEKYCCIRMVEISVIGEFLRVLPAELYDCANLNSHHATQVEARLLTHINSWHCDGFFGSEQFNTSDLVISLKDVELFYNYLSFAFSVLHSGGRNDIKDYSKCGFIRVNTDNLIPYTVLPNNEKGVPLFYFEGQTDILKVKAVPLTGWELAYLKVCCKVQGVRKDLISGNTLQIVKVSDLRAYFPKRTLFNEDCWPTPKSKSLLPKANGMVSGVNSIDRSCPWTKSTPYKSATNVLTSKDSSVSVPSAPSSLTPVVIPTKNGGVNNNNATAVKFNGVNTQMQIGKDLQAKADALKKIKVLSPPHDLSRIACIAEMNGSSREGAYTVRLIIIDKELMHCINSKPFKTEDYLVILQEFMNHFFPSVSIYPTSISVLKSCGVTTYLPNVSQIRTLNNFGFNIQQSWQIPLIPAVEVTQAMPKLKEVFRPRAAATESISNNSRSNGYKALSSNNHSSR